MTSHLFNEPSICSVNSYRNTAKLSNICIISDCVSVDLFQFSVIFITMIREMLSCLSFGADDGVVDVGISVSVNLGTRSCCNLILNFKGLLFVVLVLGFLNVRCSDITIRTCSIFSILIIYFLFTISYQFHTTYLLALSGLLKLLDRRRVLSVAFHKKYKV